MNVSNLLLFLLFLLRLLVDLRKLLAHPSTPHRAPLAGLKTHDYLLFLQSRNLFHPNRLRLIQHFISLLFSLNLVAILYRLSNHPVGFLVVFSRLILLRSTC